jgi:hypothetical protein
VTLYRIVHQELFDDLTKSVKRYETAAIEFEAEEVVDAKFIDDQDVMMILRSRGLGQSRANSYRSTNAQSDQTHLVLLPFRSGTENPLGIRYAALNEGRRGDDATEITVQWKVIDSETIEKYAKHVINHAIESFEPRFLEINGRENRRSCIVIGEDGRQIRIYDLDAIDS